MSGLRIALIIGLPVIGGCTAMFRASVALSEAAISVEEKINATFSQTIMGMIIGGLAGLWFSAILADTKPSPSTSQQNSKPAKPKSTGGAMQADAPAKNHTVKVNTREQAEPRGHGKPMGQVKPGTTEQAHLAGATKPLRIVTCENCMTRVALMTDGRCPACRTAADTVTEIS